MRLLAFDNDGVLRDESVSYQRCVRETVAFFSKGTNATEEELLESLKKSNNDWERTHSILQGRRIKVDFEKVKNYFQALYLGKKGDFTGYINNEPWLVNNRLLEQLGRNNHLVIVSGAPKSEIEYTLKRNNAQKYFRLILGMEECRDKKYGLEKAMEQFNPEEIFFCDDRPSPIKEVKKIKGVRVFGIMPPNAPAQWDKVLKEAGAEQVFANVNEYMNYIIQGEKHV